jgi:subtilisin family serine protease
MSASSCARVLAGVAAGLTVTALFAATITPASATPKQPIQSPSVAKLKLPDGTAASRVIPGRYLVETVATPLSRGGSRLATHAAADATTSAARIAGVKVADTFADLWSGISVTATEAQVRQLSQAPSVKAVYPVMRVAMPKTTKSATRVSSELTTVAANSTNFSGKAIKVGVIDTGIDYNHPDLGGSGQEGNNADFRKSGGRVLYGYDFVGDDYDSTDSTPIIQTDAFPDDCAGHGTHVAGIIGANGDPDAGGAVGVAPAVIFGAYRVFGCEGSTDTAIILKALTKAKKDGMQVVNLSLGSTFEAWPSYPDAVAAANLVKAGIVVVASAGNDGDLGLFAAGGPNVGAGVISVASYESTTIRSKAISVNGNKYPYVQVAGTATTPVDNATALTLRAASNTLACSVPATVPDGTAMLVKRGECDFINKVGNALAAGADAVVIYNNASSLESFTAEREGQPDFTIPAISVHGTQGETIATLIAESGPQNMVWLDYQKDVVNPDGGSISDFSSAGLAADLSLVPTIAAPGGKIFSTLPLERGGHGNLSGTSMAAPYVAGAAALMLQAKSSLKKHPKTVAQLLYNTADPVANAREAGVTDHPEAVFRQGSGLVNVQGALGATVSASPAVLKLGEGASHTVTVSLSNRTKVKQVYRSSLVSSISAAASTNKGDRVGTTTPDYAFSAVGGSVSSTVTVKPGKTVKVKVKITPPTVLPGRVGLLYGGWVRFTPSGTGNIISVPFAGVRGDYQSVDVLNGFKFPVTGQDSWNLPSLVSVDGSDVGPVTADGREFSMVADPSTFDVPIVLYHLDYAVSDVRLRARNVTTGKSYDVIIDWNQVNNSGTKAKNRSISLGKQSRDASFYELDFFGAYYSRGKVKAVPSGTYTLQLRVLKALGKSSMSSQWETFTTPSFGVAW